ncbi:MAG: NUDIX hydrolase [Kiloniellaceae bacterium]
MTKKTFKQQCAVLAYRRGKKGLKVVLVTSLDTGRWVLPKGNLVEGLSIRASAALEALEEAGVEGEVEKHSLGHYDYEKTELKGGGLCRVDVFAMEVTRIKRNWLEKDRRQRKWMTLKDAAAAVNEPGLKRLIARFEKSHG